MPFGNYFPGGAGVGHALDLVTTYRPRRNWLG